MEIKFSDDNIKGSAVRVGHLLSRSSTAFVLLPLTSTLTLTWMT
jgi:hypothetical protein